MFGGWVSYWQLPLISAGAWFGTLLAMLIVWLAKGRPQYPTMDAGQNIAYISDIGATGLQPLFIAGSVVSVVVFDLAFISERWLRHKGRLHHNTSWIQKGLSLAAIFFAICGAVGLILLTCLNNRYHSTAHNIGLGIFVIGYIISAIFICAEYQRLGAKFKHHILRISFGVKLFFIIVEIALAIAFLTKSRQGDYNTAAVLEWTISLLYILYVLSFVLDFMPAVGTKHDRFPTREEMAMATENGPSVSGGPVYPEEHARGYPGPNGTILNESGRPSYSSNQPMVQNTGQEQSYPHRNF